MELETQKRNTANRSDAI